MSSNKLMTVKDLVAYAVAKASSDIGKTRFNLRRGGWTSDTREWKHYLVAEGEDTYMRRHTALHLDIEVGRTLAATWKTNQYDNFIGARTLPRIIRDLAPGTDVEAMLVVAREEHAAEQRAAEESRYLQRVAVKARDLIDALNGGMRDEYIRAVMNQATREDNGAAYLVAYDTYDHPRSDD